jgi:hypothetical protein
MLRWPKADHPFIGGMRTPKWAGRLLDDGVPIASGLKEAGDLLFPHGNAAPGISVEVMTSPEHRGILECLVRSNRR